MPQTPVQIGAYNRRVTILLRPADTQRDAVGGLSVAYTDGQTVWAAIADQFSALTYQTSEQVSKATRLITLRWSRSLAVRVEDRIRYVDPTTGTVTIYEIESISNRNMQNKEVDLLCYALDGNE